MQFCFERFKQRDTLRSVNKKFMISNAQQKYVLSLHQKKYRKLNRTFIVEGRKNVHELLRSNFEIQHIFCSEEFAAELTQTQRNCPITIVNEKELNKISTLSTSDHVLAVAYQHEPTAFVLNKNAITLVLDDINDPGNLGTIMRIADWYGIKQLVCSEKTVEFYNPKVIMATMGSFARVQVHTESLVEFFATLPHNLPIWGAYLTGDSLYDIQEFSGGLLVLGSESHGISEQVKPFITKKITIPRVGAAESLNVAVSAAVLLDNLIRLK